MNLQRALGVSFFTAFAIAAGLAKAAPPVEPQPHSPPYSSSPQRAASEKLAYELALQSLQSDFEKRIVHLDTDINDSSAQTLINQLRLLDSLAPGKPITLEINSPGGRISDALRIYDVMHSLQSPVNTVCSNYCASMGTFLLVTGAHREAFPHAVIMMHGTQLAPQTSSSPGNSAFVPLSIVKEQIEALDENQRIVIDIFVSYTGEVHRAAITQIFYNREDTNLSVEEAKALGIIDRVVPLRHGPSATPAVTAPPAQLNSFAGSTAPSPCP